MIACFGSIKNIFLFILANAFYTLDKSFFHFLTCVSRVFFFFLFNQIVWLLICVVSFHFNFFVVSYFQRSTQQRISNGVETINIPKRIRSYTSYMYTNTNYRLCGHECGPLTKWLRSTPFPLCIICRAPTAWWLFRCI